jgi:hypothetical protein
LTISSSSQVSITPPCSVILHQITLKSLCRRHCIRMQLQNPEVPFFMHLLIITHETQLSHLANIPQPGMKDAGSSPEGVLGQQYAPSSGLSPPEEKESVLSRVSHEGQMSPSSTVNTCLCLRLGRRIPLQRAY